MYNAYSRFKFQNQIRLSLSLSLSLDLFSLPPANPISVEHHAPIQASIFTSSPYRQADGQIAVEEVLNKVLSQPVRPHFAIASISPSFDLQDAHQLITTKFGSHVPVITNDPSGIIGRDTLSDEFKEVQWEITEEDDMPDSPPAVSETANRAVMLTIGFLPGLKVRTNPLLKQVEVARPQIVMVDNFVTDIREFSTSVSGSKSPAAIIMFSVGHFSC
ncbi:F-box/LRR-repeat protein At5g63520-like [Bidens hawaiensis]|uniref:F-box/LRR-repeat protein At5g63520-like n=1 Tax=Bidens hawaiensis TaxID=980011 RepID=UPI00404AD9C8